MWVRKTLLLLLIPLGTVAAQEAGYLDLRGIQPRTHLRYPQTEPVCDEHGCSSNGGAVGFSIGCGAGRPEDPRALKATILSLDHSSYTERDEAEIEIKLENVGTVPMTLPWYPHVADLQSSDITARLDYLSSYFQFTLAKPGETGYLPLQMANLYGTADASNTLVTIHPGEWLHLRAIVQLNIPPDKREQIEWEANVAFGLRHEVFTPKDNGYGKNITNDYPRQSSGPAMPVQIFRRGDSQEIAAVAKKQD